MTWTKTEIKMFCTESPEKTNRITCLEKLWKNQHEIKVVLIKLKL